MRGRGDRERRDGNVSSEYDRSLDVSADGLLSISEEAAVVDLAVVGVRATELESEGRGERRLHESAVG